MTLKTSSPDMYLLERNTSGNLSNASESEELLLRCKQLYERYLFHVNANLSKGANSGSKVYLSSINDLTLNEFVVVRKLFCKLHHRDTKPLQCSRCYPLICLSERICNEGICELSSLYRALFPTVKYQSDKAVRKLMQLPVAIFKLELSGPGSQRLYVSEMRATVDYDAFCRVCQMVFSSETLKRKEEGLSKEALDVLCQLAMSESDRCLIKYSVSKSQGLSAKEAKKKYGFSDLHRKEDMIMKAAEQSQAIREAVMKLASVKNKATLRSLGHELPDSSSDSEDSDIEQLVSESDMPLNEIPKQSDEHENTSKSNATEDVLCSSDLFECNAEICDPKFDSSINNSSRTENCLQETCDFYCDSDSSVAMMGACSGCELTKGTECLGQRLISAIDPDTISKQKEDCMIVNPTPTMQHMLLMLRSNELNWFSFVEELRMLLQEFTTEALNEVLLDFAHYLSSSDINKNEERLIEQSRQAYLERVMEEENSDIESDPESDNPDDWVDIDDISSKPKKWWQSSGGFLNGECGFMPLKPLHKQASLSEKLPRE